nr:hypothetical protein [Oscillospiraceae bacterium]
QARKPDTQTEVSVYLFTGNAQTGRMCGLLRPADVPVLLPPSMTFPPSLLNLPVLPCGSRYFLFYHRGKLSVKTEEQQTCRESDDITKRE